jgi:hypothetical protein
VNVLHTIIIERKWKMEREENVKIVRRYGK